jgi:ATP-dependent DNA helicase Rep
VATLLRAFGERAAHSNPVQLAHDLIANLRYDEWLRDTCNDLKIAERRMQSVMDFVGWLRRLAKRRPEADLRVLVAHLSLISVLDADGPEAAEGVALMPIGAARGLEFAHVYVVGFEESAPAGTLAPADANDARRLAYLAISRARESVAFTVVEHRRVAGEVAQRRPSRLLAELPTDDIEYSQPTAESSGAEAVIARAVPGRGERYPRGYG